MEERKVLYLVEDCSGKRWTEWLYEYQVESYVELGYTVKEMKEKVK
jgi:hypothetical protein